MGDEGITGRESKRAHPFYRAGMAWRRLRRAHLDRHPLCARCEREGRLTPATVVHHLTPHRGDWALFVDAENLASSCKPCHDGAEQSAEARGYDVTVAEDGWPADPRHPANEGSSRRTR